MDSGAGGGASAAAAAAAGTHVAHQLYTSGLSAATKAASVAQQAGTELGSGEFGQALKRAWRPAESLRESFEDIHQFHQDLTQTLGEAVEISYDHYRPRFAGALAGAAGDALLAAHDAACQTWSDHQDKHSSAATAAAQAVGHIKGLQGRIDNLAEAGEQEFNTAIRNRDPLAAMDVWTRYNGLAEESTSEAVEKATASIRAANFTIPLDAPKTPAAKDGQQTDSGKDGKQPSDGNGKDGEKDGSATPDGSQTGTKPATPDGTKPPGATPDAAQGDIKQPAAPQADGTQTPVTQGAPTMLSQLPQAMSGAGGGGQGGGSGGGGGGSGMSSLGSAFKPSSSMGSSSSSMPTSPASSMPSAPSVPPSSSAASSMSNPGSSFQSGLASGMSAAGGGSGMGSPLAQQSVSQQGLAAHQVGGVGAAPAFGSGPAGVPLSGPGGDAGVGSSAGGSSGGGGAASPGGGGAPMMPPAAMGGAAPMAPYSAPGAGAGGAPGGGAGTVPAASSGQSAGAGSGAGAPGPVVAGGTGSTVSAPGIAALTSEVNPDLLLAQRVLGGLVRGCEDWPAPIAWAVGVVKTPFGSQVVIASSLGGGAYVPSTVFVPATARLAVADPALPFGLAQRWMGCQKPSKILVDHFEQLSKRVAGASLSAMVTTELWPQEPAGVADFLGVQHRQALGMVSVAPTLDGAHQHRLTALDPVLAHRVSAICQGRDVSLYAAAQLTAAVIQAAAQPDSTGHKLVTDDEINILQSVQRGSADAVSWKLYDELADRRDDGALVSPDSHAPIDHDGSKLTEALTLWYRHYYCAGRVVELVRTWKVSPPSLADIAYCGVQAGFGSVVTSMVNAIEQQVRSMSA